MPVEAPEKVALHLFRIVWQLLEFSHLCDGIYGVEYERIKREWLAAGCPVPVAPFITQRANTSSEVKP